jgi:hypothetical protein
MDDIYVAHHFFYVSSQLLRHPDCRAVCLSKQEGQLPENWSFLPKYWD